MPRNLYFLSDQAYDNLWRDAVAGRFVGRGAASGKGIAEYISEIIKDQFTDTRPDEYREMDESRRKNGLTLYWSDGDVRKARMLTFDDEAIERLCELAVTFRIGIGRSHRTKSVIIRTTTVTIGRVLEAIGKRWLTAKHGTPRKRTEKDKDGK